MSDHIIQLKIEDELFGGSKDPFLQNEDDFSVQEIIPRILAERSFLSLTEESLEEEINGETAPVEIQEETEPLTQSSDLDKINTIKLDLTKNINMALNEVSLSLDLVSLLLSSTKPSLAKATISPHLAKNVPLGSFNTDRLTPEQQKPKDENLSKVGQGWKYESLDRVRGLFKSKRDELASQLQKEAIFWSSINTVLSNNEILLKMRDPADNSRAIGVKYGYGDSGSSYHDKGIAVLRRNPKTGAVSFAPVFQSNNQLVSKTFKYVRVKILSKVDDEYTLTGQSKFDMDITESSDPLINDIEKARFFIFEEDLFYQLIREARTLINYNVQIISDKILVEVNDVIIEIEAIPYDENTETEEPLVTDFHSQTDSQKCQLILNYLKIMLCGYFKYNLNLKQKIPTNFTKFKQQNSHPLILRPLIGHIKHEAYIQTLQHLIDSKIEKFKDKVQFESSLTKYENIKNLNHVHNPFVKSIEKPVSKFHLVLKTLSNDKCLSIDADLTTSEIFVNMILHLRVVKYEKEEHMNANENGINVLKLTFNDFTEVDQSIGWSIQKYLAE